MIVSWDHTSKYINAWVLLCVVGGAKQEAAATAGANTERRLREEMERDREVTREAKGSVSALESRLQEALSELSQQQATAADLKIRLDQVQVKYEERELLIGCCGMSCPGGTGAGVVLGRRGVTSKSRCRGASAHVLL